MRIQSFSDDATVDLFRERSTKAARRIPKDVLGSRSTETQDARRRPAPLGSEESTGQPARGFERRRRKAAIVYA